MARKLSDMALLQIQHDRVLKRQVNELIGLAKGALLDGVVNQLEAEGIYAWLNGNADCLDEWPVSVLYDRLRGMLADGRLDETESQELMGLLMQIAAPSGAADSVAPTTLPLTVPPPPVIHRGRRFCFTGVFEFGSRAQCHQAVLERGGEPLKAVTMDLDYLVIGAVGTETWRHSSFGTKIMKAAQYREAGAPLAIIAEPYWVSRLG